MKFFENLPRRLKLVLHIVELALCLYASVALVLHFTPYAPYTDPYLVIVGVGFLALFPLIHAIIELGFGVPGTDKPDFADAIAGLMGEALTNRLKDINKVEIKATSKPDANGPSNTR